MTQTLIAVIGGNRCSAEEAKLAEEVGRLLAVKGATLLCGGLAGVMEAACRGARAAGGLTIGILPGDTRSAANPHVEVPIVTGMGHARNVILVKSAQAVIAIDGSYGTLSEIGHALQIGITVIGLDTWSLSLKGEPDEAILRAGSPEEAVDMAMAAAKNAERK